MNKYEKSWAMPEKENDAGYGYEIYPEEIASFLSSYAKCRQSNDNGWMPDKEDEKECLKALYRLHTICQNEYNSTFYRTLYKMLAKATEVFQHIQQDDMERKETISGFTEGRKAA